jgi:NADH dehydrogenase [ubiquinone] 1 alpha subcomplex assembly factor 6
MRKEPQLTGRRKYDSPAYTLQTFIPSHARSAYLSLRAFNIEIARVADSTSHVSIGQMRMKFWRDAVQKSLEGSPPKEPVAVLLAAANEALQQRNNGRGLSRSWLLRIVNEREKYLGNPPYPTLPSLETYAENTYSTLFYLTLSSFSLSSVSADHLASHIGKATGIAAVLRGLPLIAFPPPPTHHTSNTTAGPLDSAPQGAVLLPLDVMAQCGVVEEQVFRQGAAAPGLRDAVFAVATRANDHLITAREMLNNLRRGQDVGHEFEHGDDSEHGPNGSLSSTMTGPEKQWEEVQSGFGALMPAVSTAMWLEQLEKVDFDVFHLSLRRTAWQLPWRAYWAYRNRKF